MQPEKMIRITVAEGRTIWSSDVTRDPVTGVVTKQLRHRYKPGQTLDVEESEAKRLVESGHAVLAHQANDPAPITLVAGGTAGQPCGYA